MHRRAHHAETTRTRARLRPATLVLAALLAVTTACSNMTSVPSTPTLQVTAMASNPIRCAQVRAQSDANPPLYSETTSWNIPAACQPTKSDSAHWAANWFSYANVPGRTDSNRRGEIDIAFDEYSTPIYQMADATQTIRVFTTSWGYGDNLVDNVLPWNPSWEPAAGNDHEMIIVDPSTGREWTLWGVMKENWTTCATIGNLALGYHPGVDLCAAMAAIGTTDEGTISNFFTSDGSSDGFGRGLGAVQGLALLPTLDEIENGSIHHAVNMETYATMFGPSCTAAQMGTNAAGNTCGYAVAPATRLEWSNGPAASCGSVAQTNTVTDRSRSVPEGMRFVVDLTDAQIDQWLDQRQFTGAKRRTAAHLRRGPPRLRLDHLRHLVLVLVDRCGRRRQPRRRRPLGRSRDQPAGRRRRLAPRWPDHCCQPGAGTRTAEPRAGPRHAVNPRATASAAVALAAVLFGTSGVARGLGPELASSLTVGSGRIVVGGLALVVAAGVGGRWPWQASDHPPVWILVGGLATVVYQVAFFAAVDRVGVGAAAVVTIGTGPVVAGALDRFLSGRTPSIRWVAGVALALGGIVWLTTAGSDGAHTTGSAAGWLLAVLAGACYPVYGSATQRLMPGRSSLAAIATVFGAGAVLALPVFIGSIAFGGATTSGGDLVVVAYLGLAATALAYALWAIGLDRLTLSDTVALTLAEPVSAVLLSAALLDEPLGATRVLGMTVVLAGVAVATVPSRQALPVG